MPEDYKKVVLEEYRRKRDEGNLPLNLLDPTPASVRDECLIVYGERPSPSDDEALRLFFKNVGQNKDYLKIIRNSKAVEFKQIPKILNDKVPKPSDRFIELIAWLINFNLRPSTTYYKSFYTNDNSIIKEQDIVKENSPNVTEQRENTEKPKNGLTSEESENSLDKNEKTDIEGTGTTKKGKEVSKEDKSSIGLSGLTTSNRYILIALIIILFTSGSSFLLWKDNLSVSPSAPTSNEKCMYWTGDHYEPSVCNVSNKYIPVIQLNVNTLNHFKKINLPDTLTKNSLGKVWYYTSGRNREFFTDSGMHPVDTAKRLRPITHYILSNYVSYYRFLLNRLVWSIAIIVFAIILAFLLNRYLPKHHSVKQN